jgi:hypothetical protein
MSVFERNPDQFHAARWRDAEVEASSPNKRRAKRLFGAWRSNCVQSCPHGQNVKP